MLTSIHRAPVHRRFQAGNLSRSIMLDQVVKFFVVFFVVVEPISLLPLFVSLTEGANEEYRRRMANRAVLLSGSILFLFALFGAKFLELMGISLEAFRIFGGLLLFLIALEMVFARESGTRTTSREHAENRQRADISVFPLAFPFIAGPGALATILLWFGPVSITDSPLHWAALFGAALAVLVIAYVFMRLAGRLMRVIGVTGASVSSRLLGVILGALAVQFVIDGLKGAFG